MGQAYNDKKNRKKSGRERERKWHGRIDRQQIRLFVGLFSLSLALFLLQWTNSFSFCDWLPISFSPRRRWDTLFPSSRRRKEENKLTIGWLTPSSFRVVSSLVRYIQSLPSDIFLIEIKNRAFDHQARERDEVLCLITHVIRQGHWSASKKDNHYRLIISAWRNLRTFDKFVSRRLMCFLACYSQPRNNIHKTPEQISQLKKDKREKKSACYCRIGKINVAIIFQSLHSPIETFTCFVLSTDKTHYTSRPKQRSWKVWRQKRRCFSPLIRKQSQQVGFVISTWSTNDNYPHFHLINIPWSLFTNTDRRSSRLDVLLIILAYETISFA